MDFTGISSIANLAETIVERFFPKKLDDAERAKIELQLQALLATREESILAAQKAIITAEMQQQDEYTKRARPTLVYAGLFFIFLTNVGFPIVSYFLHNDLPRLSLPTEFWWAWSGVCSLWVLGRSAEKRGVTNKLVNYIVGKEK